MSRNSNLKSLVVATSVLFCSIAIPSVASAQQNFAGVDVFPSDNVWNTKIDTRSVDANSNTYIDSPALGRAKHFHPDWGADPTYGIPSNNVRAGKKAPRFSTMTFLYSDESDAGPYPISTKLKIEGASWSVKKNGGDRHVLMIDPTTKILYETFNTKSRKAADSGAIWHLDSNALRPDGWTSADAAGLPIFPGLVNYDEAASGLIKHAFRMTCNQTKGYVWPGRHLAGPQNDNTCPPLGKRLRLKGSYVIPAGSSTIVQTILTAMKQYGMFICDQGSPWYVTGTPDPRWSDTDLDVLKTLTGNDFEFIDETPMIINPDSGQAQ